MFAVKPLPDKELQKSICEMLGITYIEESFAYFAADLNEDGTAIEGLIGLLQFTMKEETGEILSLTPFPEKEEDEAMIIMERASMSLMWRSGMKQMIMKETAGPEAVLKRSGLPKIDGVYTVDLDKFFDSPCHYNK